MNDVLALTHITHEALLRIRAWLLIVVCLVASWRLLIVGQAVVVLLLAACQYTIYNNLAALFVFILILDEVRDLIVFGAEWLGQGVEGAVSSSGMAVHLEAALGLRPARFIIGYISPQKLLALKT